MAKKCLDSIEKQKRRSNVCDKQTDGQLDRQTESTTKNNRLLGWTRKSKVKKEINKGGRVMKDTEAEKYYLRICSLSFLPTSCSFNSITGVTLLI